MKNNEEKLDGIFGDYGGKKRFTVSHPDFRAPLLVAAPDEATAIVAAAKSKGARWTDYNFYAYCEVYKA